ncbi:hypothetical protein OG765_29725 [Streptomyces sp. NBC_00555]|uniref:hypothetical protein n=1 Tax=unclassified Streptomyces TaxID=2593676 RepID=UPI00214AB942|nr:MULTISPECIES: hypothetical protein [unclassified Streptomyces]MCX5015110.1 hypothetical protein [Streptomyces sp. NBC_00555]UUU44118.1 hypothetical protein JIW86_38275 [Streptomyces sp. NBC_00162]
MTDPEFQLAAVFDHVDPVAGPGFAADHPSVEDPALLALLVERLNAGTPVLMTPVLMNDVLDPERRSEVPLNFRTDGRWVWTDTVAYYLEQYALAPEPGLLAHLGSPDYEVPAPLDRAVVERAAAFVLTPAPEGEAVHVLS